MFARRVIDVRSEGIGQHLSPFRQPSGKLSLRLSAVNLKLLVNLADSGQWAERAATIASASAQRLSADSIQGIVEASLT